MIEGFFIGLSLILPIGTQNTYLLRQGTLGKHPYLAALICGICDTILICLGALGAGSIIASHVIARRIGVIGGVAFLSYYGLLSAKRAMAEREEEQDHSQADHGIQRVILSAVAFSLLNPHAILDATVLLGSIASQYADWSQRISFTSGAVLASWVWFFTLAYFATKLRPIFAKPIAAKILDGIVALFMFGVAIALAWTEIQLTAS